MKMVQAATMVPFGSAETSTTCRAELERNGSVGLSPRRADQLPHPPATPR